MLRFAILALCAALTVAAQAHAEPNAPPGATVSADELTTLRAAYRARRDAAEAAGAAYDPRSVHRSADGAPLYLNRLILAASPYLLQHAHNPVDWRPWSAETLAEAQALDRPILLSVGYAACHWCHVMEAESFDTLAVAQALNGAFIAVKVDREALPDVDAAYMRATEALTGGGGWPNTVWLTPEGAPFFARTYLPQADLLTALTRIAEAWDEDRSALRGLADKVSAAIAPPEHPGAGDPDALGGELRAAAVDALALQHNAFSGGFSETLQFPRAPALRFLLDHWRRTGDADALDMTLLTLDAILAGGLHDHVGGGFHRYAVDPDWAQPHFEKMLYTQAQLIQVLTEAWEATRAPRYRRGAEHAIAYVLRDMRDTSGGFFSAEDADSPPAPGAERIEGAFYAWSAEALTAALTPEEANAISTAFSLRGPGLIEAGPTLRADLDSVADLAAFDAALEKLRRARESRPRPLRDDKIIAGWNGMMIAALGHAGAAFENASYSEAAEKAAEAIWSRLWRPSADEKAVGRLHRFYAPGSDDDTPPPGALTDTAWLGLGLLALSDAAPTSERRMLWLERAEMLSAAAVARFGQTSGRFALAEQDGPLGPVLETADDAVPSGESALLELFARLARRETGFIADDRARGLAAALAPSLTAPEADPTARLAALQAAAILLEGESEARRALAHGKVHLTARRMPDRLILRIAIEDGWHINAHRPHDDMLIPTTFTGDGLGEALYPKAHDVTLAFSPQPLAVLEGVVEIEAAILSPEGPVEATLTLQACSDEICLEPEVAAFRFDLRAP